MAATLGKIYFITLVLNIRILVFGIDVWIVVYFHLWYHQDAFDVVRREIEIIRILAEVVGVIGFLAVHFPVPCHGSIP